MAEMKRLLTDLTDIEGVDSAIVVSHDGFVLEAATTGDVDSEGVGAVISTGIGVNKAIGKELNLGDLRQGMIEYLDGLVIISLLSEDAILAVTAASGSNLGHIRYSVKKAAAEISKMV